MSTVYIVMPNWGLMSRPIGAVFGNREAAEQYATHCDERGDYPGCAQIEEWEVLDSLAERVTEAEAALERVKALADDWGRGRAPTAAAELRRHIEGE